MRSTWMRWNLAALLAVLALFAVGCGGDANEGDNGDAATPTGQAGDEAAADDEPVEQVSLNYVEVVRSPLYAAAYVAETQGFFAEEGLEVGLQTANGGDKVTAMLVAGEADIALVGPDTSVFVNANPEGDVQLRIFGLQVVSDGAFLISREPVEDFSWEDVRGKTIIGFRPGSMPENVLETALVENGLEPGTDVTIRTELAAPTNIAAFTEGQADYLLWVEPTTSQLVAEGRGYVAAAMAEEIGPVPYTAYTATTGYIDDNPDVIERWMRAIQKANDWIADASSEDVAAEISSYFEDVDQEVLASAVDRYREAGVWPEGPIGVPDEGEIDRLQEILVDRGVLESDAQLGYDELVDPSFAG